MVVISHSLVSDLQCLFLSHCQHLLMTKTLQNLYSDKQTRIFCLHLCMLQITVTLFFVWIMLIIDSHRNLLTIFNILYKTFNTSLHQILNWSVKIVFPSLLKGKYQSNSGVCAGFSYAKVIFLHSSYYGTVACICAGNSADNSEMYWLLLISTQSQGLFYSSHHLNSQNSWFQLTKRVFQTIRHHDQK